MRFLSNQVQARRIIGVLFTALFASCSLAAQETTHAPNMSGLDLPDGPQPQQAQTLSIVSASSDDPSTISGQVLDPSGASVAGALVNLQHTNGLSEGTVNAGLDGEFVFIGVVPGSYIIVVTSNDFQPYITAPLVVMAHGALVVEPISLAIASENTEITVRPTETIAAKQIKAEEQQRLFGIFPVFYVSYVKDAAPMTAKQKYSMAAHDSLDWTSLLGVSAAAGVQQANNTFPGYGQGAAGYGKRWAAQFADGRSSDFLSHAVFPALFHQDPRYFYQGTGTNKARLYHALSSVFIARSDSGGVMPNYSYLLGTLASGALSNGYYPHGDRGPHLVFTVAAIGIAGRAGLAVYREFLQKRFVPKVAVNSRP